MADRSIVVRLRAEVQGFNQAMAQASKATEQVGKGAEQAAKQADTAMGRLVQSAQNNREAWTSAGTTLTAFGAASLGALGLATKAAMDWESSWAGVQKTVDGTAPQMAALEQGLRGLARELPASHAEIAAVAEAAGQLGIATPNILGFTRTMIDMGEATNLSAEEAAVSLSRFMNITQTSQSDVGRLGAAIVGLGNNFATTESEIVDMSMRIAGAGEQAGLTEGEIFGMATALSSVGIEAEAGGTAISRTMKRIGMEVDTGGDKLGTFAQVAGMSAEQFSTSWREDPAAAMEAFVTGLSNTEQMGMSTNQVLSELGITAIRESDSLLRLSAAGDVLGDAMAQGNDEFEKGSALIEEAAKRYETAESRMRMAGNAIVDAGISIGSVFLPVVAEAADGIASMAGAFADLPGPVHAVAGGLAGVAGAVGLSAGGFLLLAPRVLDTVSAFRDLGTISPGTASKVGRATLAIGKIGLAAGVAAAAFPILVDAMRGAEDAIKGIDRASLDLGMNELSANLMDAADSGNAFDSILGDLYESGAVTTDSFADLGEAVQGVHRLDTDWFAKTGKSLNLTNSDLKALEERFDATGEALTMMAQTDLPMAQEAFSQLWEEAEAGGASFDQVLDVLPGFRDTLVGIATEMGVATDDATLLKIATGELSPAMDDAAGAAGDFEEELSGVEQAAADATSALDDHLGSLTEVADAFLAARDASRQYEDALADAYALLEEDDIAGHWGDGTEAARELEEAIDGVAGAYLREMETARENGDAVGGIMQDRYDEIVALGEAYGIPQEELNEYLEQIGLTPEVIEQTVELETSQAKADWAALWDEIGYHPPEVPVGADTSPAEDEVVLFEDGVVSSDPTLAPVGADTSQAQEEVTIWGSQVGDVPATVYVQGDLYGVEATMEAFYAEMQEQDWTVEINGETATAEEALGVLLEEVNNGNGSVTINGVTFPADTSLMALIEAINMSEGEVTITGDNSPAKSETDEAKRHADGTEGTIDVDADTSDAESSTNHAARDRSSQITATARTSSANAAINAAARSRTAYVNVVATGATSALRAGMRSAGFATGGPVHGPGTGTSDSIPALLSNGEHVITAREVALAGGQDAIYRMREAIRSGFKFANGGAVGGPVGAVQSMPYMQVRPQNVSASVDAGALTAAVRSGMQGMGVQLNLDGRTLYGAVVDAGKAQRRPFVTGRS